MWGKKKKKQHRNKGCSQKIVNWLFDFLNIQKDLRAKATYHSHKNDFLAAFSIY